LEIFRKRGSVVDRTGTCRRKTNGNWRYVTDVSKKVGSWICAADEHVCCIGMYWSKRAFIS